MMGSHHNAAPSSKPTLIYILGPSYSGSTLLTFLLSKHPRIATIGELKATGMGNVEEYRCSCGQLIRACDFWKEVTTRCRGRGVAFSVSEFDTKLRSNGGLADRLVNTSVRGPAFESMRSLALSLLPGARASLRESMRRNYEIGEVVRLLQGKDVLLDSSKTPSRLLHMAESGLWDLKVICLRRDGRGVSNSNRKHMKVAMRRAAERWAHDATEILNTLRRLSDVAVVHARYEDLCAAPENVLAELTEKLELGRMDFAGGLLDDSTKHILGNNMRLGSVAEIRFDESWRTELHAADLAQFEAVAGAVNSRLGYE